MNDRFNGDSETNVEGIALQFASAMPLEDADACRDIVTVFPRFVELALENRAQREARRRKEENKGHDD